MPDISRPAPQRTRRPSRPPTRGSVPSRAAREARLPWGGLARRLTTWYRRHRRDLPWRRSSDPYRIWVSEVMLQQTTVKAVVPYYERFLDRFPTLRDLARAPMSEVLAAWSGLGYYRRARSLHAAARQVLALHGGRMPESRDALLALPGIGRYTAGAILSLAFGRREPVVDGNVARVLTRLRLERGDVRSGRVLERLWGAARALVEASARPGDLNQALMELGATVCTPAAPSCATCPVSFVCAARALGVQETIPPARPRRKAVRQRLALALVRRDGRLLMRRRRTTGLMDGLWEFPEVSATGRAVAGDPAIAAGRRLLTFPHSITYRRIEVRVHEGRLLGQPPGPAYRWVTPAAARRLPASSLVRKTLDRLEALRTRV